jgi:LmbE family N-acetylglucosaminyl deacetylase
MSANDPGQPPVSAVNQSPMSYATWTHNREAPPIALSIGAHPDDVEFGSGGTLAKWAEAGTIVHHLVMTDGSKGTWDVNADTSSLVSLRQEEQRNAATRLGATGTVTFLGYVDGELRHTDEAVDHVARVIRTLQPNVVLTHDPWKRYRLHPDHRNTGFIVCDAIVAARDPHFLKHHFSDGLAHHRPDALLLWEADEPNHVEDIASVRATKLAALEEHRSQFESTMKAVDDQTMAAFRDRITRRMSELGAPHGYEAAEVFHLMSQL